MREIQMLKTVENVQEMKRQFYTGGDAYKALKVSRV